MVETNLMRYWALVKATATEAYYLFQDRSIGLHTLQPLNEPGFTQTICMVSISYSDLMPITITFRPVKILGARVLFYYACSDLVIHSSVERHLSENFRRRDSCGRWCDYDAMNIHNCILMLEGLKKYELLRFDGDGYAPVSFDAHNAKDAAGAGADPGQEVPTRAPGVDG